MATIPSATNTGVPLNIDMVRAAFAQAQQNYPGVASWKAGFASSLKEATSSTGLGTATAGGVAGGTGVANKFPGGGQLRKFAGKNWQWLVPLILTIYLGSQLKKRGERQSVALQTEYTKEMGEQISPEAMVYQAMMPAIQQEQNLVTNLLFQQLTGNQGPQLARGEERIGGQQNSSQGY